MVVVSGDVVQANPEFAPSRWVYAVAGILGVACVEEAMVPLWNLLTLVDRLDVFCGRVFLQGCFFRSCLDRGQHDLSCTLPVTVERAARTAGPCVHVEKSLTSGPATATKNRMTGIGRADSTNVMRF